MHIYSSATNDVNMHENSCHLAADLQCQSIIIEHTSKCMDWITISTFFFYYKEGNLMPLKGETLMKKAEKYSK